MYSSGGMTSTPNLCTYPSPCFPLHYYQQDRTTSGLLFPAAVTAPPAVEHYNTFYNFANKLNSDAPTVSSLPPTKSEPAHNFRKDRHSKIVTAQGPRDRRVRLSIQVARKFFDLHDTLGLDRASETLDWLLTNSQPAIDDLVKSKHSSCPTVDEGRSRSDSTEAAEIGDKHYLKSKSVILNSTNITQDQRVSMHHEEKARIASLLARESRAKARARARERTRQKMSIRHLFQTKKLLPHDLRIAANRLSIWNELSYLNKSRAPYFNVGTDQVAQSKIPVLFPETNSQTSVRLGEAYDKKFNTGHNS